MTASLAYAQRLKRSRLCLLVIVLFSILLVGCQGGHGIFDPAAEQIDAAPFGGFSEYRKGISEHLQRHRIGIEGFDEAQQVAWNLPFESRPAAHCANTQAESVGLLLVHGLSDSPFVFRDLAGALAQRCVWVCTLLLQGHGTRPGDLVSARADVWRTQVRQHFEAFSGEVDRAFIGGFSLGGGLATELALESMQGDDRRNPARPAGLVAIAPVWELNGLRDYLWIAPYAALVTDFVEEEPELNPVKYESLAINAAVQIAEIRASVQAGLRRQPAIDMPLLLVATEADSVINLDFLAEQFVERFDHPANRFLIYRDTRAPAPEAWRDPRIASFNSYLPEQRILEFSHMSLTNSPDNVLYGRVAPLGRCLEPNGLALDRCLALDEDELWFSAWHPGPQAVPTSRLTFNPYFDQLVGEINAFLDRAVTSAR